VMGDDRPSQIVVQSLVRAMFAEQVAREAGFGQRSPDFFLIGMLSSLEVLIGRPMAEILTQIPVSHEIRDTLLGRSTTLSPIWGLVLAYERAEWDQVRQLATLADVSAGRLPGLYRDSVQWVDRIYRA
ncbi:MAG: hypothetical protein U0133_20810, partial [Gemmatimonadales bacterium]